MKPYKELCFKGTWSYADETVEPDTRPIPFVTLDLESYKLEMVNSHVPHKLKFTFYCHELSNTVPDLTDRLKADLLLCAHIQMHCWYDDWRSVLIDNPQFPREVTDSEHPWRVLHKTLKLVEEFDSSEMTFERVRDSLEKVISGIWRKK